MAIAANEIPSASVPASAEVEVVVADDRMSATLRVKLADPSAPVTLAQMVDAMTRAGLKPLPEDDLRRTFEQVTAAPSDFIVVRGSSPIDDTPAQVEQLLVDPRLTQADVSHYERRRYLIAKAGEAILRLIPRVCGKDGVDVCGNSIPRRQPPDEKLSLGKNVTYAPDGSTVLANIFGHVKLERGSVWVEPLFEVGGDVDFSIGNIDFAGDVHVHRNVLDLFQVRSTAGVFIDGAVEAAQVSAGADLVVRGGVIGKDKGHCLAKGNISLRFATNAIVRAGGDIRALMDITSSRVICGGILDVPKGSIVGGAICARGGLNCQTLGSASGTTTLVEVGIDPWLRLRIVKHLRELRRLRQQTRTPGPGAAEAEAQIASILQDLRRAIGTAQAASPPQITVARNLYSGVTIRMPNLECVVETSMLGPMRLFPRTGSDGTELIAASGGSEIPLPTRQRRDGIMHAALRVLGRTALTDGMIPIR